MQELNRDLYAGRMPIHDMGAEHRRMDEEVRYSQGFESLIARIATTFLREPVGAADRGIDYAVREVCRFVQADRCYFFQLQSDTGEMAFTSDWWDLDAEVERLKNWRVADFPWLTECLQDQKTVVISRVADLPAAAVAERAYWQQRGVWSLIIVPVHSAGALIGGMGFESRNPERIWRERDPQLLRAVAELIGNALERQKAETALRQAVADAQAGQDRIATILRSVADGLLVADGQGRIILANRGAEKLLKIRRKRLLESALTDLAPELSRSGRHTFDFCAPDGRILEVRSAPLRRRKGGGGTVVLLRDISRAREVERLKNEFVATAAHELRTPLTSIQGFAEILLLKEELGSEERHELLAIIHEQAAALAEIISDLLDISRIEAGEGMTIRKEVCALPDLVRQSLARISGGRHDFRLDIPEEAAVVVADRGKLRQVLDNLLGNAVKYSPEGGNITISARRVPEGTEIAVQDHGIGMSGEQLRRIFDKFYRGDTSNAAPPGIGLGMSIVRHIVQAHDGHIEVHSAPGHGTKVLVTLPGLPPVAADAATL
jgi:signal transduction histidine kinase